MPDEDYGDFDSEEEAILTALLADASATLDQKPQEDGRGTDDKGADRPRRRSTRLARKSDGAANLEAAQQSTSHAPGRASRDEGNGIPGSHHIRGTIEYELPSGDSGAAALRPVMETGASGERGNQATSQPLYPSLNFARGDRPGELSPPPPELPEEGANKSVAKVDSGAAASGDAHDAKVSADAPAESLIDREPPSSTPDPRSPLERFRTRGRPLSVTDLVSPSWCEIQWAFILSRYGKKPANAAMKSGTRIHRRLEEQVHTTVRVDVQTREDALGLRVWNIIQGLKTLRDNGLTRELEVWGVFDGQLVNGVIDELSYVCPDTALEPGVTETADGGQTRMTDFLLANAIRSQPTTSDSQAEQPPPTSSQGSQASQGSRLRRLRSMRQLTSRIYICDVKTRASVTIPRGAAFRPTWLQLLLYQHLLAQMVRDAVSLSLICRTLRLNPDAIFSDTFIAQVGALQENFHSPPESPSETATQPSSAPDAVDILLDHNSLRLLWDLLRAETQKTFPLGERSMGSVLKAEYRDPESGDIRGMKTFKYDAEVIENYVAGALDWWNGRREPVGVEVDEAFKCRSCDFAGECAWRIERDAEARDKSRQRHSSSRV